MAISDKLQELIDIKQDIKEALENKGVDLTGGAPQGETWVINETPTNISVWTRFNISFLSNNKNYDRILFDQNSNSKNEIAYGGPNEIVYYDSTGGWVNQAYRTVTFETAPTGNLLTWLQANAVKQTGSGGLTGVAFSGYAEKIDELPAVVELTQAQYDALSVYDNNTYYLIVEE